VTQSERGLGIAAVLICSIGYSKLYVVLVFHTEVKPLAADTSPASAMEGKSRIDKSIITFIYR
jgi:hypothetical protein